MLQEANLIDEIPGKFPKYLMKVAGKCILMPYRQACISYESGYIDVEIGSFVMEHDSRVREMNLEDQKLIREGAQRLTVCK